MFLGCNTRSPVTRPTGGPGNRSAGGPACRQSIRCLFHQVRYSRLVAIADSKHWGKKTYNNAISILRRAFEFGYRNHPEQLNPARSLRSARLKKADRPRIDPFCMQDAETLIATIHRDWGEAQGNYDEFRLFTGMRPSEEIALVLSDLDLANGIVSVNKARVAGIDRDQTKTGEDRRITPSRERGPFFSGNSRCAHGSKPQV
jgi:integrase